MTEPEQRSGPGGPADPAAAGRQAASSTIDSPDAIEVLDVGWTVGGAVILAEISLKIGKGELLAVIGPNGAGKSTLVNMI